MCWLLALQLLFAKVLVFLVFAVLVEPVVLVTQCLKALSQTELCLALLQTQISASQLLAAILSEPLTERYLLYWLQAQRLKHTPTHL